MGVYSEKICLSENLVKLRKKAGMTQRQLADELCVSDKTVSKWERGLGYPEIHQLLNLSRVFSVSADSLLRGGSSGIAIAGNMLTDRVKTINAYPERQMLATISSVSLAVGGCVPNTAINLAKIDPSIPVKAVGRVGGDEDGRYIINELRKNRINTENVLISKDKMTSFSDVMNAADTGERTFFHYRGANAELSPDDIPLRKLNCRMLHIGYILLLDMFDRENSEYGTEMARFLRKAQDAGMRTSIDVVSDSEGKFDKIIPALKYTDTAVMNEIEGCGAAHLPPRDKNGVLIKENIRKAMERLMSYGVCERVILHCPEAGFILNISGQFTAVPSLCLPDGFIKGSVGAGDAFCAGCLYGIYNGYNDKQILEFASGAAALNLSAEDSVSGMKDAEQIKKFIKNTKRNRI